MGPVLAPLYINYGLQKEELLATQATNRVIVHIVKIFVYGFLARSNCHILVMELSWV
ncbi:MAG: hypothetical protein WCO29_12675 [Nostocales cyanobacterium ELA583]|jgi:hypothetical protein